MMRTRRKRLGAITAVFALIGSLLVGFIATAGVASASTSQNNACLGVTGTFSTFPIPITGTASPNPVNAGATTTLSGTGVTIAVDSTLVAAGVATGLVAVSPTLAQVGTADPTGGPPALFGQNAVVAATGSVKLQIAGTHTVETVPDGQQPGRGQHHLLGGVRRDDDADLHRYAEPAVATQPDAGHVGHRQHPVG